MRILVLLLVLAGCAVEGRPVPARPASWQLEISAFGAWDHTVESWLLDDLLVVATDKSIFARSRTTGDLRWSVDVPAASRFCGSSRQIVHGKVVLAFGVNTPRGACDNVTVLDLASRKLEWTRQVPGKSNYKSYLEIFGDHVVFTSDNHVDGFALADGSPRWTLPLGLCHSLDLASVSAKPTIISRCSFEPSGLIVVDPATGKVDHRRNLTDDEVKTKQLGGSFVSVSPLVMRVTSLGNESYGAYVVFNNDLSVKSVIPAGQKTDPRSALNVNPAGVGESGPKPEYPVLVTDDLLITPTLPSNGQANSLAAFDLATGTQRWKTSVPGSWVQRPVALDGDELTFVTTGRFGAKGDHQLMLAKVTDGSARPRGDVVKGSELLDNLENCRLTWADGRAYAIRWTKNRHLSPMFTLG